MKKNQSGQFVGAQLISKTDGSAVTTGTTTAYVTGDAGTQAAGSVGSGACTHEGNGYWTYAPAQAETNYDYVAFTFVNTSAVNVTVQIYPSFPQTGDNYARIGPAVGSPTQTLSEDINNLWLDTNDIQSRLPAALVSGRMDSSVGAMAANTLTATAIASDAITAAKIADGAIDAATFAAGAIDATAIAADAITAAKIADGAIDAATFAAGAINAAAIAADAITDAKVAADVTIASVTGAVGSVTGNVGGNVTGSVGSIATGGITSGSFAAGAIDAAAIAADAIGSSELAASAITEIQAGLSTLDAAGVRAAVGLASANLDTQLAGIDTTTDILATMVEAGTGSPSYYRFRADALEQAPTGGSAPSAATIADAVWDEARADHVAAGSFGQGVASVQGNVTGSVGSVTGNVGGNVTGSVGSIASGGIAAASFAAGAINAAAIATDAIDADALAADAVAEIQSGLATSAALSTVASNVTAIKATSDLLGVMIELAPGSPTYYRFNTGALERVWDAAVAGHGAGTTGEALAAAGAAGDPWITALPGSYTSGQAGFILGTNLNATVSSRATQTSVDTIDDFLDSEIAAIQAVTDILNTMIELGTGSPTYYRYKATALEQGAGSAPSAATIADAVWDEARAGHVSAGSFGEGVASVQGNVTGSVASVSGNVGGNVAGSVGSVTGNVGGNVTGSVGSIATGGIAAASFAAGAIDAAAIAANAIGASELAADAVAEIQSGLSTLDAAGVRSAVGLASANLDTQLDALPTAAENADKFLGRNLATGSDGGRTVKDALRSLRNKSAIVTGTLTVYEEDDTTTAWTAAVLTTAGDPLSSIDPA